MLRHLLIRDFVIVDRLELAFDQGFGALTGETGAGKSILIDALALTLGERADAGVVREGADRAEVAATFDIANLPHVHQWLAENDLEDGGELLLRRVVDAGGRSRAYINGSPSTAQQLREVGEWLVDIHGQHAHQSLLRSDAQRQLLDAHAGLTGLSKEVSLLYRAWRDAEDALVSAQSGQAQAEREREQLLWQINELAALNFSESMWSTVEADHKRLSHAAGLLEGAQLALALLQEDEQACESLMDRAADKLSELVTYDAGLAEAEGLIRSAQAELAEAASQLRRYVDRMEVDPVRLTDIETQMDAVLVLARKYRVQPLGLIELQAQWQARLAQIEANVDLAALEQRRHLAADAFTAKAKALSLGRQSAAIEMSDAVSKTMQQLALSSGVFMVALVPLEREAAFGLEQVEFRIGGLAGQQPRPLAKVASGGELSRISLAIQVLTSRAASVPTLIFDEVDVGIGGGVAEIVGCLLRELGMERQVLCVTHLPQVAARANWQWQVAKSRQEGRVVSSIQPLETESRVREIARMLGGVELTEITLQHARELLQIA